MAGTSEFTDQRLPEKLREQGTDCADWQDYAGYAFEGQVESVARAISDVHAEQGHPFPLTCSWNGELEGGVRGLAVSVYLGEHLYLSRMLELKRLTADREATGAAQAVAIKQRLTVAHRELMAFVERHRLEGGR